MKAFEEVHERRQEGHDGPRWVPVVAAALAVLAAVTSYFSNIRSTGAIIAKNDAIVATTLASDKYAEYQASRLKFYIAQSALDSGVQSSGNPKRLKANAKREAAKGPPLLEAAQKFKEEATHANARSERLLAQHETIEISTTLFEVSIVLVSITALVGSRLLPVVAAVASAFGFVFLFYGLVR